LKYLGRKFLKVSFGRNSRYIPHPVLKDGAFFEIDILMHPYIPILKNVALRGAE